jgi:crotonobetainyl-CoA:carnitine CoA-transferase CaiB-like acyl-CoA transferase
VTLKSHSSATVQPLPLDGVRVVDLSRVLAGPFCSMTLGDLGAPVIKVERPDTGDDTRGWGPPFDAAGESAYFLSTNRNKLSIAADFSSSGDLALLLELIGEADVVIDNFLPGVLSRYGLDKGALLSRHARLIWCTISGFGPASSRPGYDFVVQAESGWMAITGPADGAPTKAGVALVDVMAGKDAATAILAALVGRGANRPVERSLTITLAGSAAAALVNVAQNTLVTGMDARRWGNAHPNLVPYQLFAAADRPIVVAVGTDAQWRAAATALDLPSLAGDPRLATNAGRLRHRAEIVDGVEARLREQPAAHWIERLAHAGVPCGLVRTVAEALRDVAASPRTGVAPAAGGSVRHAPPRLDQHGELIRKHYWSAFEHLPILAST